MVYYTQEKAKKGANIMEKKALTVFQRVWTELNYFVIIVLIIGQIVTKTDFFIGQMTYLVANIVSFIRCFILNRPLADKVKDGCMLGITSGLIMMVILESMNIHLF